MWPTRREICESSDLILAWVVRCMTHDSCVTHATNVYDHCYSFLIVVGQGQWNQIQFPHSGFRRMVLQMMLFLATIMHHWARYVLRRQLKTDVWCDTADTGIFQTALGLTGEVLRDSFCLELWSWSWSCFGLLDSDSDFWSMTPMIHITIISRYQIIKSFEFDSCWIHTRYLSCSLWLHSSFRKNLLVMKKMTPWPP